jgi:hypothetical protein
MFRSPLEAGEISTFLQVGQGMHGDMAMQS